MSDRHDQISAPPRPPARAGAVEPVRIHRVARERAQRRPAPGPPTSTSTTPVRAPVRVAVHERAHTGATKPVRRPIALTIEPATLDAYDALKRFHYRDGGAGGGTRPGVGATVFAAWAPRPDHFAGDPLDKYLDRPAPPRELAGVLVRARPALTNTLRDFATRGRYVGLTPAARAHAINAELRVIARVIVSPRYRGLGVATRLVQHALDHPETIYTEAIAAMGRVSPFFERAGMTRYDAPRRAADDRLLEALDETGLDRRALLLETSLLRARLARLDPTARTLIEHELIHWAASARFLETRRADRASLDDAARLAARRLFGRPVYYLHRASDASLPAEPETTA
ncbi:MAG: GNAT family N-acetyltransferase [Phycisphaerales bacterium]